MDLSDGRALIPAQPTLVYSPHPLLPAARREMHYAHFLPEETISQYMIRQGIDPRGRVVLQINGHYLPRAMWARTRPKPGTLITLRAAVAGGGGDSKNPLATVLTLALLVTAPQLAGLAGFTQGTMAFAAATTAIQIGGSLLINAMLPPPRPQLAEAQLRGQEAPSPTYGLQGGSNRARPYEPLPWIMGRHRVFPDLGASEYTEFEGDDQYLYQCYNFGLGDVLLSDFRIGNTPISSYEDVQMQISGADGQLSLFPWDVATTAGAALEPDAAVQRTSSLNVTRLAVEITGSLYAARAGGTDPCSVDIEIKYRLVGATAWSDFAAGTTPAYYTHYWSAGYEQTYARGEDIITEWVQVDHGGTDAGEHVEGAAHATIAGATWTYRAYADLAPGEAAPEQAYLVPVSYVTITNQTTKPIRMTYTGIVAAGQYEVKVTRLTDAFTDDALVASLVWSQLRSYSPDATNYTGQTRVALKIRASGQLNGTVAQLSAMASARTQVWDGVSAWAQLETSNPAWWALAVLRGLVHTGSGRLIAGAGLADARIDLDAFKAFALWCEAQGWTFNAVLDRQMSLADLVNAILRCGMGSLSQASGLHGVVWDAPDQPISAVFGMGNIVRDSYRVSYITERTAEEVVINFPNPALDWQQDRVSALVPGITNPVTTSTVDLWGCTDKNMAGAMANLMAADQYYHNARLSFETDHEGNVAQRGDTVLLAHDLMRTTWGYSGRLAGGTTASVLVLDREVSFTAGRSHYVLVKKPDGSYGIYDVVYTAGDSLTLTLSTPLAFNPSADADGHPVYDYVWMFDLRSTPGRRVKVVEVKPASRTRIGFTVVDDDADYYLRKSVPFTHVERSPAGSQAPELANLTVSEELRSSGQGYIVRLTLTWDVTAGRYDHANVRIGVNGAPMELVGQPTGRRLDFDVPDGASVEIEVQGLHPLGYKGENATLASTYAVVGGAFIPSTVAWMSIDGEVLSWAVVEELVLGYELRYQYGINLSWEDASLLHDGILTEARWRHPEGLPPGTLTIMVRAVSPGRQYSAASAYIVTELGDKLTANVVESFAQATAFDGTKTDCAVSAGELIADDASDLFWAADEGTFWKSDTDLFWLPDVWAAMSYAFSFTPSAAAAGSTLTLTLEIAGESYTVEYRRHQPAQFWPADADLFWGADDDLFWPASPDYVPFPGQIVAVNDTYDMRVSIAQSETRGTITTLTPVIDVPDITEELENVAIDAGGTRLPITKSYTAIDTVQLTLQNDGGTAITVTIEDKDAALGPLIRTRNAAQAAVAGVVDARIKGR